MDGGLSSRQGCFRYLGLGVALALLITACRPAPETKSYQLHGQVLAVHPTNSRSRFGTKTSSAICPA
jgi:hypothetical protein